MTQGRGGPHSTPTPTALVYQAYFILVLKGRVLVPLAQERAWRGLGGRVLVPCTTGDRKSLLLQGIRGKGPDQKTAHLLEGRVLMETAAISAGRD